MTITIDKAGRIVVPKELRQRLGLRPNSELEILDHPKGILLQRVDAQPSLTELDGLLVHLGRAENGASLDRVVESVREERVQDVLR